MPIPIQMATMSQNHLAVEQLAQNNKLTEAEKLVRWQSILRPCFSGSFSTKAPGPC